MALRQHLPRLHRHRARERALAVARHGDVTARDVSERHPPLMRRSAARQLLPALSVADREANAALSWREALSAAAELMWAVVEPLLVDLHRSGERPAPLWQF